CGRGQVRRRLPRLRARAVHLRSSGKTVKGSVTMPRLPWILLAFLTPLLFPEAASAQKQVRRLKIDKESVQVGFASATKGSDYGFKAGLWTPIVVRFVDDEQGDIRLPVSDDGTASGELFVEVPDNDNVYNAYPQKF